MPISDELKRIYAVAPTDDYYVETLEMIHPGFPTGSRYITNQVGGFTGRVPKRYPTDQFPDTYRDQFFQYYPFAALPPRTEGEANVILQITLGNASREMMDDLEALADSPQVPLTVIYRIYLNSDPTVVQNNPPLQLDVIGASADLTTVSFQATLANLRALPFPSMLYDVNMYPGLSR